MFRSRWLNALQLTAVLLVGLSLAPCAQIVRAEENGPAPTQQASPMPNAVPSDPGAEAKAKPTKEEAARLLIEKHLQDFLQETDSLLERRIDGLKGFFEERKLGAPLFASQVLSTTSKLRVAGSLVELFVNKTAEAMGLIEDSGPDSFTFYAKGCFRETVLDPGNAKRAIEEAVAGFRGDVAEAEGRLLVALKADLGDDALAAPAGLPGMASGVDAFGLCDALVDDAVDDAINDFNASLAMFVVSNFISNELADQVTPDDASRKRQFLTNLATGAAVDAALDKGLRAATGYDPEGAIATKVKAGIDRICVSIVEGDADLRKAFADWSTYRRCHPDESIRELAGRAADAIKAGANIGLVPRLESLRNDRYRSLWKALMSEFAGPEAARSPFLMYTPLSADECPPADLFVRVANDVFARFGGGR